MRHTFLVLLRCSWPQSKNSQQGFTLPLALVTFTVGVLIVIPIVTLVEVAFGANRVVADDEWRARANEAAIEVVMADLVRGTDALSSYTPPSITLNNLTPSVSIASPASLAIATPTPVAYYVDPGIAHPNMATVVGNEGYLVIFHNVFTGTLQVNWAYTPASISRIAVWDVDLSDFGDTPGRITTFPFRVQPILDTGRTRGLSTFIRSGEVPTQAGKVYSVVFYNVGAGDALTVIPFLQGAGPTDRTWVRLTAFKDYVITATVDGVTHRVLARQIPGITKPPTGSWATNNISFITNYVKILSWKRE